MASTFDIALVIFAILSSGYIAYLWLDNAETADKADPRGEPELCPISLTTGCCSTPLARQRSFAR